MRLSISRFKNRLFYGWVIVASFVIMGTVLWGLRFSFGIFLKSIEAEFDLTRAATSAIFSVYMVLGSLFAILGGWALDRYGPRIVVLLLGLFAGLSLLLTSQTNAPWQLFITYSLLLSMGTSAGYTVTMSTVSRWFDKKRGLALGITGSGAGLGMIIIAPFATYLISRFDWQMAYLIMGLITWVIIIPISSLLRKDPYEIGALPDGAKSYSKKDTGTLPDKAGSAQLLGPSPAQVFRTRGFLSISFMVLLWALCSFLVTTHLVPYITDLGISAGDAAAVFGLIGAVSIAGRIVLGIVNDRIGPKMVAIISLLLQFASMFWLMWSKEIWMFYLFALVYGFGQGGSGIIIAALVSDTFGLSNMGVILGLIDVGFGIGAAIGPAIGGLSYDISHSYSMAFLAGAAALLVGIIFAALIKKETGRIPQDD